VELIGSPASPFVRKVRIVLALYNLPYRWTVDAPSQPGSRVAEFNPLGKIPVLLTAAGDPLYDSSVIVDYLDAIAPHPALIPAQPLQRIAVKRWEALADGLLDSAVRIRGERARDPGEQNTADIAKQTGKIERALAAASAQLGGRTWCHGATHSLADIAIGVGLFYLDFRLPEIPWQERHPNLLRLQRTLGEWPAFAQTRP